MNPRNLVLGGVMIGLLFAASILWIFAPVHRAVDVVAVIGAGQILGASLAALALLLAAAVARARGQRGLLETTRAPRVVVAIAAFALALELALIMGARGAFAGWPAFGNAAAVLVGVAAIYDGRRPWRGWFSVVALVLMLGSVETLRERGVLVYQLQSSLTDRETSYHLEQSCGTAGARRFADLAERTELHAELDGNVGRLVPSSYPAERWPAAGTAVFHARGHVEVPWLTCWMPLYKRAHVSTRITMTGEVEAPVGRCTADVTLTIDTHHRTRGLQTCRAFRQALADQVGTSIRDLTEQVAR